MRTEIVCSNNLYSNCPPSIYYSIIKDKVLLTTITTIFEKQFLSNVEVNNVSNFIAYYVGHYGLLLTSEDFYHLSTLYKKFNKDEYKNLLKKKLFL